MGVVGPTRWSVFFGILFFTLKDAFNMNNCKGSILFQAAALHNHHLLIAFSSDVIFACSCTLDEKNEQFCLGKEERVAFIKVVMKLLDRGQYSKDDSLAETVSIATSVLSYVEPSLVLPFVATNFQLALETVRIYMRHTYYL